jgi:hypothetical protein
MIPIEIMNPLSEATNNVTLDGLKSLTYNRKKDAIAESEG